jgi:LuxR family maltose regulon positive regulatory protein
VAAEPDGPAPQVAGVACVGIAGVLYERDELDAALQYATDGIPLSGQLAYTPPLANGLVTLARIRQAQGDVDAAVRWVRTRGLTAEDKPSYPREREYLVLVRVLLATQAPEQALELLERLHTLAAAQGRTGSLIQVRALQALARAARSLRRRPPRRATISPASWTPSSGPACRSARRSATAVRWWPGWSSR